METVVIIAVECLYRSSQPDLIYCILIRCSRNETSYRFFSTFLRNQGIVTKDIGLLFTSLACISFLVSSTFTSKILRSIGPVLTCASGLTLVGSSLLFMGLAASGSALMQPSFTILAATAAFYFGGVADGYVNVIQSFILVFLLS